MISSVEVFPARSPIPLMAPFDLTGAGRDGRQGVGDRQAEVVVAMRGDDHVFAPAPHLFIDPAHQLNELGRGCISNGVGNVDGGGPGFDSCLADGDHKLGI